MFANSLTAIAPTDMETRLKKKYLADSAPAIVTTIWRPGTWVGFRELFHHLLTLRKVFAKDTKVCRAALFKKLPHTFVISTDR